MARLRLLGPAREAAGTGSVVAPTGRVAEVVDWAGAQLGPALAELLPRCAVWVNGRPGSPDDPVGASDEVALLPPLSGG